ncbi:MAG: universal stress protein [Candidatus Dormibacterales bacterium]
MFKLILVALDGSPNSQRALPTAVEVAKKFESQIFVLHVAEHDRGRAAAYTLESPAEATKLVADAVETVRKAGLKAAGEVRDAGAQHAAKFIVDAANEKGADLIVMGSRGLSDMQGVFLGSVTHKVIQTARIPVLVDRPHVSKETAAETKTAIEV